MIELFKMLNGMYSTDACIKFKFVDREVNRTRGNKLKMYQGHVQYNLKGGRLEFHGRYWFTCKIVSQRY